MHQNLSLGKNTTYPKKYSPEILDPISRDETRQFLLKNVSALNQGRLPDFFGVDIWQAYEISWINPKGKPAVATLKLSVPSNSLNIVESKSLKLYLNSLNQHIFESVEDVQRCIQKDISNVVVASVSVEIFNVEEEIRPASSHQDAEWVLLDELDVVANEYTVNPLLLKTCDEIVEKQIYSHLLRSSCPVTDQPDWGSLFVIYSGPLIEEESLLNYIISYRNNQEFHEQCVERIFCDIWSHCKPQNLTVAASYMRRGGVDINPIRTSSSALTFEFPNIARQ